MAYPAALPSYTTTSGGEVLGLASGGLGLSGLLNAHGVDITGLGTKIGTGASTPTAGKVLRANGTGTSVWGAVDLTADVTGTLPVANGGTGVTSLGSGVAAFLGTPSSANLRSALTDETGTGSAVFGTSPSITTPVIDQFGTASGLGAVWPTWVPTYSGFTPGNGVLTFADFCQIGKRVDARYHFVAGTTTSIAAGSCTISLPVTSATYGATLTDIIGIFEFEDVSAGAFYTGHMAQSSTTVARPLIVNTAGTYGTWASLENGVPVAIATGDIISFTLTYQAA
jgi:hypothetical protein